MAHPDSFAREFVRRLQSRPRQARQELPTFVDHGPDLDKLVSSSTPAAFSLGTGASIYGNALLPAILSAKREVVLVTCYWARSKTLAALREALEHVAEHRRRHGGDGRRLRIRICLSSAGLFQKLFHPSSRDGYVYPPSLWSGKLGLPEPSVLEAARIDLSVKSLFFLPFSIMHPKFLIVDRERAWLPSCNLSWEPWLEGCVEITGDAVSGLVQFYARTWDPAQAALLPEVDAPVASAPGLALSMTSAADVVVKFAPSAVLTIALPSSHHRNPHFRPFPWQKTPPPPATPLNIALDQLFESAARRIFVQTPNLTCRHAINSLLKALQRGVDVHMVTNTGMMLMEQLLTAGTTTAWCVRHFAKSYNALRSSPSQTRSGRQDSGADAILGGAPQPGSLRISYFGPLRRDRAGRSDVEEGSSGEEPVHSHVKLIIVDGEYTVLGSGNMDRASWYTSQELGILFHSAAVATEVKTAVDRVLEGRLHTVFDSAAG